MNIIFIIFERIVDLPNPNIGYIRMSLRFKQRGKQYCKVVMS